MSRKQSSMTRCSACSNRKSQASAALIVIIQFQLSIQASVNLYKYIIHTERG